MDWTDQVRQIQWTKWVGWAEWRQCKKWTTGVGKDNLDNNGLLETEVQMNLMG